MPLTVISPAEMKALYDAGAEHIIPKENASKELLRLATASSEFEGGRDEIGLVLDTEAILQIKRYERRGLSLPKTEGEVDTYLGGNSDIPGLTNRELLATFLDIRTNAGNWSPLEYGIIQTATQLDVFAIQVNSQGGKASQFLFEILEEYSDLMTIDPDKLSDEDYMRKVLESLDAEANVAKEKATKLALTKGIIDSLAKKTIEYYEETRNLLQKIIKFKEYLTQCSNQVKGKEELLKQLKIDQELQQKKDELDAKKKRLKDLNDEYNMFVGLAFIGAPGGVIGLAISGTIFGKKAAKVRKQIKSVEAEIRDLEKKIDELSRLINVITSLDSRLVGLYTVMIQAEKGVMQLVTIWTTINELLKAASSSANEVINAPDVLTLWVEFDNIIAPWKEVGKNAAIVSKQFQDALDQWAQENR